MPSVTPGEQISPGDIGALFKAFAEKSLGPYPGSKYNGAATVFGFTNGTWTPVPWRPNVGYGLGAAVFYNNQIFFSKVADNTRVPTDAANWRTVNDRGGYDNAATYNQLDQVNVNGYEFISTPLTQRGNPPLDEYGNPNPGWMQPWLSAYNRLRNNLAAYINDVEPLFPWQSSVSGEQTYDGVLTGWPIVSPSAFYPDLAFYYPDTGQPESITISGGCEIGASGRYTTTVKKAVFLYDGNPGGPLGGAPSGPIYLGDEALFKTFEADIIVGGTEPVYISGEVEVDLTIQGPASATIDRTLQPSAYVANYRIDAGTISGKALVSIDSSNWIPQTGWEIIDSPPMQGGSYPIVRSNAPWINGPATTSVRCVCQIPNPVLVQPGRYSIKLTFTQSDDTAQTVAVEHRDQNIVVIQAITGNSFSWGAKVFPPEGVGSPMSLIGSLNVSYTNNQSEPTAGIHNTKQPMRILAPKPGYADIYGATIGVFSVETPTENEPFSSPFPEPVFGPDEIFGSTSLTVSASTDGMWFGSTPPIQNPGMNLQSQMPWNLLWSTLTGLGAPPYDTPGSPSPPQLFNQPYYAQISVTPANPPTRTPGQITCFGFRPAYANFETSLQPPPWLPGVWYTQGFQIMDANGNIQKCVTPGISGSVAPGGYNSGVAMQWSTQLGATLTEGGVPNVLLPAGSDIALPYAQVTWQLVKVVNIHIPDQWNPAVPYTPGRKINDRNGNVQELISGWFCKTNYAAGKWVTDSNNIVQFIKTPGTSGATAPQWNSTTGATTNDGTAVWVSTGKTIFQTIGGAQRPEPAWGSKAGAITLDSLYIWRCKSVYGIPCWQSSRARMFSVPKYPTVPAAHATTWQPSTPYFFGDSVIDTNGNQQTVIDGWTSGYYYAGVQIHDKNGNVQQAMATGYTATTEPTWATTLGATTPDGNPSAQQKMSSWKLVAIGGAILSGSSTPGWSLSNGGITRDGGFNFGQPNGSYLSWQCTQLVPTQVFTMPSNFDPVDLWIYKVSINRIGTANASGIVVPPNGQIPVTLGCLRNGNFVPFATYQTGGTYSVMWPIFTANPLVYQANEEVDVQAIAMTPINSFWGSVGYPILAAFYNDIMEILELLD